MTTEPWISREAVEWLANGQRGLSSDSMFFHILKIETGSKNHTPSDPADLWRCRLLIEQVPEVRAKFQSMKTASTVWMRLVNNWDALCTRMDIEAPRWRHGEGSAPETYAIMKGLGC